MRYFIKVVCLFVSLSVQFYGKGQCLTVDGTLTDVNTQKKVMQASFWISNGSKRLSVGKTTTGTFVLALPCDAKSFFVEAEGYRSFVISLNIDRTKSDVINWLLPVLLVPMDQQSSDKPYSQQEQTFFEMTDSTKKGAPMALREFMVIDVIKNAPISAKVCLFYTKNQKKDCFDVSKSKHKVVNFQEKDIIAIEAKAEGYQSFNGNLIVDKLDGRNRLYEIKLSQELNMISLLVNELTEPINITLEYDGKKNTLKKGTNNRFYGVLIPHKNYQIRVIGEKKNILFENFIAINKGFNTRFLNLKSPENQPIVVSNTNPSLPSHESNIETSKPLILKEKYTVLFDQSDFKLRAESQKILDNLAQLLLQNRKTFARIVGYTDNTGNVTQNKRLSELRTLVIKNYLSAKGVEDKRFFLMGLGSKNAISPNDIEENKAKNRRVEIQLVE